jgi:MoxR-like ATPase
MTISASSPSMAEPVTELVTRAAAKLPAALAALEYGLIERRRAVRLALLAALAGEHTLLIGPPGTAKSELARRLHLAFAEARYFERLLTRFSVPEELFGPLSISALEQDRYERQTAGFLPQASIAFIDEVFKANSAILNALLTLLNEREFDNGAGRERCPLISVIGATNEVPADEVGEAFFDRFLLRLAVAPVSAEGFRQLLGLDPTATLPTFAAFDAADRAALADAAQRVTLADEVAPLLLELRAHLAAEETYVSDRRWVKIVWLLKTAAASEGRQRVERWDLWLLPYCVAPDAERQAACAAWLASRLGARDAVTPERLTRVVEAFEAQLGIEQEAEDLDYDDSGRLKFNLGSGGADAVADAKGAEQAARMTYTRRRRYGEAHIRARVGQIDDLAARLVGYAAELQTARHELAAYAQQSVWLDADFTAQASAAFALSGEIVAVLAERIAGVRAGFLALPRLPADPGDVPEPVAHEALTGA